MQEKNSLQEIREHNSQVIGKAIQEAGSRLVEQLDFSHPPLRFEAVAQAKILDKDGNSVAIDVLALMNEDDPLDGDQHNKHLGIFLVPEGRLRVEAYANDMHSFEEGIEVCTVNWTFSELFNKPELLDHGYIQTSVLYEGLGLASALVKQGEVLKDKVAVILAKHLGKETVISSVYDDSIGQWTSKIVSQMPGYTEVETKVGHVRRFEKRTDVGK